MNVSLCVFVCMHAYTNGHVYVCVRVRACVRACVCVCVSVHVCVSTSVHIIWIDVHSIDMKVVGLERKMADDRRRWRRTIVAATPDEDGEKEDACDVCTCLPACMHLRVCNVCRQIFNLQASATVAYVCMISQNYNKNIFDITNKKQLWIIESY